MNRVFVKREDARKYFPLKGDTLTRIANKICEPGTTWEQVAIYNWGTTVPREVNRALLEQVGCSIVNDHPADSVLDPGAGITKFVLIPKTWKKSGLEHRKIHTIKVRKPLPAPAVSILKLDKWFIPETETCDIDYRLEGIKERADKVMLEVYGSNYSKVKAEADGDFVKYTFTATDVPLQKQVRKAAESVPGNRYEIRDWKGESTASEGILQPRGKQKRHVNVACSPYTVLLRYFKSDADKEARIKLDPFWVTFTKPPAAVAPEDASLKVTWTVEKCKKLKYGQLEFWDKDGTVVYRKALGEGDLSEGKHTYEWKLGKNAKPENMPYRVQIQAHTDMFEDNGVALAAMHTEVRLWIHAETGTKAKPVEEPQSLDFGIAPFLPPPKPGKTSVKKYKLILAKGGFHPGPVDDDDARAEFKIALKEFQRSHPKASKNPFASYKRMNANGALHQDAKNALAKLKVEARPLFGHADAQGDYKFMGKTDEVTPLLKDKNAALTVWADDRHCYTAGAPDPGALVAMDDYRGAMSIGDGRVTKDAASIARPWIPLEASLPLLSKNDPLRPASAPPAVTPQMRRAIGPIRVDWTFGELDPDVSVIPVAANKDNTRARKWTEEVVKNNAPDKVGAADCGGIRPTASMGDYYKAAFGFGKPDSLLPWLAVDDSGNKAVASVVHDDLGQDANKVHADYLGKAGVYARPSRIAGDGYRFRAQVSFKQIPGVSNNPNRAVLESRYTALPQAHTAGLRVWRKAAFRGYIGWMKTAVPGWETTADAATGYYRPAFVRFVQEGPDPEAHQEFKVSKLISAKQYEDLVNSKLNKTGQPYHGLDAKYTEGYIWPYLHKPNWGIAARREDLNAFSTWLSAHLEETSWDMFSKELIVLLTEKIESKYGRLRGHVLAEFASSPRVLAIEYKCDVCGDKMSEVVNDPNGEVHAATGIKANFRMQGVKCKAVPCAGRYRRESRITIDDGLPLCAIGRPLGGAWLYSGRKADVWAHEMGHHRHLQHAQANSDSADATAPGAQLDQHDSQNNPLQAGSAKNHQKCWDRSCIMSYFKKEPRVFCGKCLLKNRGWAVQGIANPGGDKKDA